MRHTSPTLEVQFYQQLGALFYAVAAIDKKIQKSEYVTLKTLIRSEWVPLDTSIDECGTDAAFQIEIVFDWLVYINSNADACLEAFLQFKKENELLFSKTIKQLIWKTSNAIALAFSGKNKSEVIVLTKLKLALMTEGN